MNCTKCGAEVASSASFCEYCGAPVEQQPSEPIPQTNQEPQPAALPQKKENILAGIVGALIGAAIGGGSIVLASQFGITASICGLILAICTIKGYELLGGKLSKVGLIICVLLIAVTPYIADRIDWAIVVVREFSDIGITFAEAFGIIPALIEEGAIEQGAYISNLLMIYLFALIGGGSVIWTAFKKK